MSQSIRVILSGTLLLAVSLSAFTSPNNSIWAEAPRATTVAARESAEAKKEKQLREGDTIEDRFGHFKETGDRLHFILTDTATHQAFRVLENLALERVSRVIDEKPGKRDWTVSGSISEYRGNYYIFLTRAILKSKRVSE